MIQIAEFGDFPAIVDAVGIGVGRRKIGCENIGAFVVIMQHEIRSKAEEGDEILIGADHGSERESVRGCAAGSSGNEVEALAIAVVDEEIGGGVLIVGREIGGATLEDCKAAIRGDSGAVGEVIAND